LSANRTEAWSVYVTIGPADCQIVINSIFVYVHTTLPGIIKKYRTTIIITEICKKKFVKNCFDQIGVPDARAREEILSLILEETSHDLSGPELHAIAQVLESYNLDLSLPTGEV
jgi:hypothetical protein